MIGKARLNRPIGLVARVCAALLLALLAQVHLASGASAATNGTAYNPLSALPPPVRAGQQAFTGTDTKKRSVALVISGRTAVAYVCDGDATDAWFSGTYDVATGKAKLSSASGATFEATVSSIGASGSHSVGGRTAFTLKPATTSTPLLRERYTLSNGVTATAGWITTNDGRIVGILSSSDGTKTGAQDSPSDTTAVPFTIGTAYGSLRCGILAARIAWNVQVGDTQQVADQTTRLNQGCTRFGEAGGVSTS